MRSVQTPTEEWMSDNAHALVDCRWGSCISYAACRKYQASRSRYVIHFNGDGAPLTRVNPEYLRCLFPAPCPNLISDEEAAEIRAQNRLASDETSAQRRKRINRAKSWDRFVNPDRMLEEEDWRRSLLLT